VNAFDAGCSLCRLRDMVHARGSTPSGSSKVSLTKVGEEDSGALDEYVLRFDVAMPYLSTVNVSQCIRKTAKEATKQRELVSVVSRKSIVLTQITICHRTHE
jgi:hypothetical protein